MATLTYRGVTYQQPMGSDSAEAQVYPGVYRGIATTIPTADSMGHEKHKQSLVYRGVAYAPGVDYAPTGQLRPAF